MTIGRFYKYFELILKYPKYLFQNCRGVCFVDMLNSNFYFWFSTTKFFTIKWALIQSFKFQITNAVKYCRVNCMYHIFIYTIPIHIILFWLLCVAGIKIFKRLGSFHSVNAFYCSWTKTMFLNNIIFKIGCVCKYLLIVKGETSPIMHCK